MKSVRYLIWGCVLLVGLFSVRASANETLPESIKELLVKHGIAESEVGLEVRETGSDALILSLNANTPHNPASAMKVLTTLAGLELLHPTYQWKTSYLIAGKVDGDRLKGNLIIVGGGDPFLTLERFWSHLQSIRTRGIKHIDGNLIIDRSLFQLTSHDPNAFDGKPQRLYNVGPDAALTNFSATQFVIEPVGNTVRIVAEPPLANLVVDNQLKTHNGKCVNRNAGWSMSTQRKDGKLVATFTGEYRVRCGNHSIGRSVLSNEEYTFQLFKQLWQDMGGTISGGYSNSLAPENAVEILVVPSRPLGENIASTNKYSNNVMARNLLLTIGFESALSLKKKTKDTRVSGVLQIISWLQKVGINTDDIVIDNGAGLSRVSRISAAQLAAVLSHGWRSTWQPEYLASFSLAALDGTMRKRLRKTELVGRVRMKTGLVKGVRSMAGYVHAKNGKHYIVTMLIDSVKVNYWNGNEIQDALLKWTYYQQ